MSASLCSNDEPQHHSGDDHIAASTDEDHLRSDNVDNAIEESRSELTDHSEKEDANVLDQMKQDDTDHEASSDADLVMREQNAEEVAAVASTLLTMAHTPIGDLADDEVSLATARVTLKEVKPDIETPNGNDSESTFSDVSTYLTECKDEVSALSNKVMLLEEEKERRDTELFRMQENNKLLFSEVRRLLRCLKEVNSGVATPNGEDPAVVFSSVRAYLTESKNRQSLLSEKLTLLEVENDKKSEDLGNMKAALEQANSRASTAEDNLERYLQDYKEIQEVLETTKTNLGQANSKASGAKDKAKKHGLGLQKSKKKLKVAEDRPLEGDDVISKRKNVTTGIELSQEIVSGGIANKIRLLADEFKRTCEDLGSTKSDLQQANFRAGTAQKELEATQANLEQANHDASSAMDEANKSLRELQDSLEDAERSLTSYRDKATQWGKLIGNMKKVMSFIKFPREVVSMDIVCKIKWLTAERKRTCEELGSVKVNLEQANFRADAAEKELEMSKLNLEQANLKANRELGAMKLNLEQAKSELNERCTELKAAELEVKTMEEIKHAVTPIEFPIETPPTDTLTRVKCLADYYRNQEGTKKLLFDMKANIREKIAGELSEKVRAIVDAAVGEATDVENPNPGTTSSPTMAQESRTELGPLHAGSDHSTVQEIGTSVNTHEQQQVQIQASGSTSAPQLNGNGTSTNDERQSTSTSAASSNGSSAPPSLFQPSESHAPRASGPANGDSPQQHVMLYQLQQTPRQPPGSAVIAQQAFGPWYGNSPHPHFMTGTSAIMHHQQQQAPIWAPGPAMAPPAFPTGFGPGYGFSPHPQIGADMYQQQQFLPQPFYNGADPGFGHSPYHQQHGGGPYYYYYPLGDGSAGGD